MEGTERLSQEIDIYAFAICCGEILTMGALPWPLMDDDAVRRLVLSGYLLLHYSVSACFFIALTHTPLPACLTR